VRIAIDFDGTIHDPTNRRPGYKLGQPILAAPQALTKLKELGHELIVFPTWADRQDRRQAIVSWLDYFKVPYDDITSVKPEAGLYIDNNGYRFDNWRATIEFINTLK
jgi:hypothetical protein